MPHSKFHKTSVEDNAADSPNYQLGLKRSPSMFFDGNTAYRTEEKVLGKGRGGIVRELIPVATENSKQVMALVVKKNLNTRQKPTDLIRAKAFIDTAYPELSRYTHVFNSDSGKDARLVMPKMGSITLSKVLSDQTRTVNSRHAYYIKAIDAVISLNEKGFSHNDAHVNNILFDDSDNCFLIDGERFGKKVGADLDFQYLKYDDMYSYQIKPSSLWNESVFKDKQYYPGILYTKFEKEKQYIEYHILNQQGKLIKGKITEQDCRVILSPEDYKTIMDNIFNHDKITPCIMTQLEQMLPILLDITSYRGHTLVGRGNVLSSNFCERVQNTEIRELKDLKQAIIGEMKSNHELILNLAQRLHTLISRSLDKALERTAVKDLEKFERLTLLQTIAQKIDVNPEDFPFDEHNTKNLIENMVSDLVNMFYQVEQITYSGEPNWLSTFMFLAKRNPYQDVCALVDVIREELRSNMIHIPGALLQRTEVLQLTPLTDESLSMTPTK